MNKAFHLSQDSRLKIFFTKSIFQAQKAEEIIVTVAWIWYWTYAWLSPPLVFLFGIQLIPNQDSTLHL